MKPKQIVKTEVIQAGSKPDIDTDFRNDLREDVFNHVAEVYGEDNVASIITLSTLKGKGAFKSLSTIYRKPYAQANKISALIPDDVTLQGIFDEEDEGYRSGESFRVATTGEEWDEVLTGARRIEGRIKNWGVHACGVIISSRPLQDVIPVMVRQNDGRRITQWEYSECEATGLLKYDFLGLTTIDLITLAVRYIMKSGKPVPSMPELVAGPMDDKKTYELFQRGDTAGVFQFGSDLVIDFCKEMLPSSIEDVAAATALCRPGPLSSGAHMAYAMRKNGREETRLLHPSFKGTKVEEILEETYQLVVYQEQIMKIARQVADFTSREADDLRKAMGKKKLKLLEGYKEQFINAAKAKGYQEEALEILWETMAAFGAYGFNFAHSIAYAMTSYQCAYLKANYPVEFMAALIAQNVGDKDDTRDFLQEAARMGIRVGPVDVNHSDVHVAPATSEDTKYDIVFGFSGVSSVSESNARVIVEEREAHGPFTSVQDMLDRCAPLGVTRKVFENIALAGGFDGFGVSRKGVVNALEGMLKNNKMQAAKGEDMFSMMGLKEDVPTVAIDEKDYPYADRLKLEADTIGLYLTGNPLDRLGSGLGRGGVITLDEVAKSPRTTSATIVGCITGMEVKNKRNKSIRVMIDDGKAVVPAGVAREIVKGLDRAAAMTKVEALYQKGEIPPLELVKLAADDSVEPQEPLEVNSVYVMEIVYRPAYEDKPAAASIKALRPLKTSHEGVLPIRLRRRVREGEDRKETLKALTILAQEVSQKFPGDYPIQVGTWFEKSELVPDEHGGRMRALGSAPALEKGDEAIGNRPEPSYAPPRRRELLATEIAEKVHYLETPFKAAKVPGLEEFLTDALGSSCVDFGILSPTENSYD